MNETTTKVYQLSHKVALKNCITTIRDIELDSTYEVIIRPIKIAKTLSQLGGLFGLWAEYISNEVGESIDYIHKSWKAKFLSRIYIADHLNNESKSYNESIDSWVELLHHYQEIKDTEKLLVHARRISLKWSSTDQMTRYMKAIESHYQAEGHPLPVLDKYRKYYK